jgi:DNA (cytosine-5)-methyltransferase 1
MRFISLFSGIGGFDQAFENAGMVCDSMVEIDKNCQNILRRHFPNAKLFDDVKEVGIATHDRKSIDVICGGFPCQDLSVAGKRAGLAGDRSGLWFEFARVIDELEPRWVVIENVPGLLSSNKGKDFAVIIRWLAERGYGVAWRILDAQYFGVPQRRRRVFIVASLGSGRCAEVLFERESVSGDIEASQKEGEETPVATLRGFGHGWQGQHNDTNAVIAPTLDAGYFKKRYSNQQFFSQKGDGFPITAYNIQHNDGGEHKRKDRPNGGLYVNETDKALTVGTTDLTAICMSSGQANAEIVKDGSPSLTLLHEQPIVFQQNTRDEVRLMGGEGQYAGALGAQPGAKQQNYIAWEMQHASEAYRESGDISPTLQQRMGTGGNNIPLVGIRRLTPTECERLQGFPDGWTDGQSDSTRYRQLGNAVAVPVVEWIGKRIATLL